MSSNTKRIMLVVGFALSVGAAFWYGGAQNSRDDEHKPTNTASVSGNYVERIDSAPEALARARPASNRLREQLFLRKLFEASKHLPATEDRTEPLPSAVEGAPEEPASSPQMEAQEQAEVDAEEIREHGIDRLKHHMLSEAVDTERTDQVTARYLTGIEYNDLSLRPDVQCTSEVCEVSFAVSDVRTLMQLEDMNEQINKAGDAVLVETEGDPSRGTVRGVKYYFVDEDQLDEIAGEDVSDAVMPGSYSVAR